MSQTNERNQVFLLQKLQEIKTLLTTQFSSTPNGLLENNVFWGSILPDFERIENQLLSLCELYNYVMTTKIPISSPNLGYFCVLPTEVFFHIFSFLDLADLCRCSAVCKEWLKITSDDQLYKIICEKQGYETDKPPARSWKWVLRCHSRVFEDIIRNGPGMRINEDKGQYIGEWKDNMRHGYGTQKWPDGSKYCGEWEDDKRHGIGTMTWPDNQSYEGEWRYSRKEGRGVETWADGRRYDGEYKNSNMHGFGTYTWPGGDKYVGEWKDDNMHGEGTYLWPNGSKYEGSWAFDEHNGSGKYTCPGGESYEGEWKNNERHGKGVEKWVSGHIYEGEWFENRKHGKGGRFIWPDNDYYIGEWKEGRRYGRGILVSQAKVYYQYWSFDCVMDELDKGIERGIELCNEQDIIELGLEKCNNVERILHLVRTKRQREDEQEIRKAKKKKVCHLLTK